MTSCYKKNMDAHERAMGQASIQFCCNCESMKRSSSSSGGGKSGGGKSASSNKYHNESVIAVEVKSKNDVISEWQVVWLKLLKDSDITSEVLQLRDKI